jgi:hypothetical protein
MGAPSDGQREERRKSADSFFEVDLEGQLGWYDRKASKSKSWFLVLSFVILLAGSATAVIQLWATPPDQPITWVPVISAVLGAAVALSKGMERLLRNEELWTAYRQAAEAMKRERRLYTNGAGEYAWIDSEEAAYRRFVENTEEILSEEAKVYWRRHPRDEEGKHDAREEI